MIATVTPCMRRGSVSGRPAQAKDREPEPHLEHNARAHERLRQVRVALRATGVRARQCCRVPAKKAPASTHLLESNKACDEHASRGNGANKD
jgi:hypothetical protein